MGSPTRYRVRPPDPGRKPGISWVNPRDTGPRESVAGAGRSGSVLGVADVAEVDVAVVLEVFLVVVLEFEVFLVVDDVHGGLLGARGRAVDADVLGVQLAVVVTVRTLVGGDQAAGAVRADLRAADVLTVLGVRVDVRVLLGDPLVQRLPLQ